MKEQYILGLHIGHDATATLIDGSGKVLAAIAEERMTRVKYHMGFPFQSIEEVIRVAGIRKEQITHVASSTKRMIFPGTEDYNALFFLRDLKAVAANDYFNRPMKGKVRSLLDLTLSNLTPKNGMSPEAYRSASEKLTLDRQAEVLREIGLGHARLETYDHHQCHAASARYMSGCEEALVITMDGAGDGLCATASLARKGAALERVSGASDQVSPGRLYSEVTGFVGFKRLRHEGKITGLAAYGNADRFYDAFREFVRFNPETEQFEYEQEEVSRLGSKVRTVQRILKGRATNVVHVAEFYDFLEANCDPKADMKDLAAAAQKVLEELSVEYVRHFLQKYPYRKVLLAGGVFANVRVNQLIAEIPGVEFVYIHQNMGDGGNATGAAFLHLYETLQTAYSGYQPADVYFGPGYSDAEIEGALKSAGVRYERHNDIELKVAQLLQDGKVVGRFHGRMEYGPRALGNRSILANTRDRTINDWLNQRLNRTEFMPFAPSMLGPRAHEVLENYDRHVSDYADRFMTITYHVKPEWQDAMQAATHVDGTARPQVVWPEDNSSYFRIIDAFYQLSGIPSIINTSFNMHEEPIVTTPEDAIRSFQQGSLDFLAIENFLCSL